MKRKKILLSMFIILISMKIAAVDIKPKFRLALDFWCNPIYYESLLKIYSTGFNGSVMGGIVLNQFTIGLEVFEHYINMSGSDDKRLLKGAYNLVRGTLNGYYRANSIFELKWGVGGAWLSNAFSYKKSSFILNNTGGISILLDGIIRPVKYMDIIILTKLDLFIYPAGYVEPYFFGGARLVVHPYFQWLNLYAEVGGMPWVYQNKEVKIQTGMFSWAVGISCDMTIPDSFVKPKKSDTITNDDIYRNNPEIRPDLVKIDTLKNAKDGDSIFFYKILLNPANKELKKESEYILDQIINVMNDRRNINLEIRTHTRNTGNTKVEIEQSKLKAEVIKFYLIKNNVSSDRISTFGFGSFYDKFYRRNAADNYDDAVEIRLISKKDIYDEGVYTQLRNMGKNTVVQIPGIEFNNNTNDFTKLSNQALDKIAIILIERNTMMISIKGFSDYSGDALKDLKIAALRANKIKEYLIGKDIDPNRIKVAASGSIYSTNSIIGQAIEITILN